MTRSSVLIDRGLKSFGKTTAEGIEANLTPAHDAALAGEPYYAGQPGIWSVEAKPQEDGSSAHIVVRIFAG